MSSCFHLWYSHGTELDGVPLKSNALSPVVGHHKHSQDQQDFLRSFFDKGFNNGAAKAEQRAFHKQKTVRIDKKKTLNQSAKEIPKIHKSIFPFPPGDDEAVPWKYAPLRPPPVGPSKVHVVRTYHSRECKSTCVTFM